MIKKFTQIFVVFAMILAIFPGCESFAAASFSTTNGSAVVYARNTDYTTSLLGWGDGYLKESSASGTSGEYLTAKGGSSSSPSGSKLSFTVTTDESGRYSLWVRVKATSSNGATWVNVNNEGYIRKDFRTDNEWKWVKLSGGVYVESGQSVSIKLYPKDDGHSIDEFILTNKNTYVPDGIVTGTSGIQNTTLTTDYGIPSITPPAEHPRVMFRATDVSKIIANSTKSQNTVAKSHLETLVSTSFSGTVSGADSSDRNIENYIEANAFYYAIYGDEQKGRLAVNELINYLKSVRYSESNSQYTRYMGCTVFKAAEVYDWCYNLLTNDEKQIIIDLAEGIMSGMEIGYPNIGLGNVTGHGSEAQLLRDMLSFGIAVYDERPDIYNHVMGRIEKEMVPARNYYYKSNSVHQGSSYGYYRFYWDLWAEKLISAMSGKSLFSEDMAQVGYYMIYNRRPDGRMFIQGDDASLEWQHYNGHSAQTAFFAGALFNNEYFKGEYRNTRNSEDFTNTNFRNDKSFNSVFWLIVNNPDVAFKTDRSNLTKSRYFGSPNGTILAKTGWDYTRSDSSDNNTASAMMKIGERFASNHDHLDAGTFQLFYKGMLASDSGVYDEYGTTHDSQYAKRTVAHNALTIYDSNERFSVLGNGTSNDGGQKWAGEPKTYDDWMSNDYKRGTVIDHEIAKDNSYSYIKGDITPAYSSDKAEKVVRSMSFLQTDNATFPAIMVIYDNVVSKTTSQTKKFLIHTQAEPTISGNTTTVVNNNTITYSGGATAEYNGRMTMNTLLPENPAITKIGGSGKQYSVNGTNYAPTGEQSYHEGGWGRVEITASEASASTEFLNVLAVSDGGCTENVSSTLIRGTNVVGTKTLNNVVLFSNQTNTADGRIENNAQFTVDGSDTKLKFTVFGVKAGNWIVKRNGSVVVQKIATEDGASISFEGAAGDYVLSYGAMVYEQFSSSNVSTGYVTEVKGTANNSTWARAHGGGGTSRTSVSMQAKTTVTSATGLINAHDTSGTGYAGRFVHSTFRLSSDAAFQIRIRNGGSNTQWMNFKSDGTINANSSSAVNCGVKWTPGKEHRYDIVADLQTGMGYLYIDGVLASRTFNLQTNGKWYGYLLYTSGTWVSGNTMLWKYYGNSNVAYTLFNDTDGHIVTIEDVINYTGISDKLTTSDDTNLIMHDDKIKNYFAPQSGTTANYTGDNSVTLSMSSASIVPSVYMLSGFYHDSATTGVGNTVNVGGRWLRLSFDQTIEHADKTQIRLRSDGTNYFGINFHPADDKMAVSVDYDEYSDSTVLNKAWTDKVKVDILIDVTLKKAYYFIDGKQVGGESSYSDGESVLNDIRYYIQGQNAVVKLEKLEYKVYNLKKEFNELYAEITNNPVYWTESGNTIDVDSEYIGMCVTAKNTFGTEAITGGKVIAVACDDNNQLVDVQSWDYVDGVSNEEIIFERKDNITTIKVYCWIYDDLMPLAKTQEFEITDYIN